MKLNQVGFAFALALTATVTGCATDASEVDQPGSDDDETPDSEPLPTTADGVYTLHSKFDLATNLPGRVGTVTNIIISATDDSNDPVKFIYEKVVEGLPSGALKNGLTAAGPLVTGYLNEQLLEIAPTFAVKMVQLGNQFGSMATNFGTVSRLEVTKSGAGYVSRHVTTGVEFKVTDRGQLVEIEYPFADYGMNDIAVENVAVELETSGKLIIQSHSFGMSFGQVLRLGIDQMLIPFIDEDSDNLGELFQSLINCRAVGEAVFDAIDLGSPGAFEAACKAGLTTGANFIYTKIAEIDANALELSLTGSAKAIDRNRDGKMDDLQRGTWTGTVKYASAPAPLGTATFSGRAN